VRKQPASAMKLNSRQRRDEFLLPTIRFKCNWTQFVARLLSRMPIWRQNLIT